MITTPKLHVDGLLQVVEHIKHDPDDPIYGRCNHFNIFQGNAKSVTKTALEWKAAGKTNIWVEVASPMESALRPEMAMFYQPGQKHLTPEDEGRNDARRGHSANQNPYISEYMKGQWLKGWESQRRRIQRKRTSGWRMPAGAIYAGRPSLWGNPYTVGQPAAELGGELVTDENCLTLFEGHCERMLAEDPHWLDPLYDKLIACWCPLSRSCHVDVILRILSARPRAIAA
jgi:hypothetical protein